MRWKNNDNSSGKIITAILMMCGPAPQRAWAIFGITSGQLTIKDLWTVCISNPWLQVNILVIHGFNLTYSGLSLFRRYPGHPHTRSPERRQNPLWRRHFRQPKSRVTKFVTRFFTNSTRSGDKITKSGHSSRRRFPWRWTQTFPRRFWTLWRADKSI